MCVLLKRYVLQYCRILDVYSLSTTSFYDKRITEKPEINKQCKVLKLYYRNALNIQQLENINTSIHVYRHLPLIERGMWIDQIEYEGISPAQLMPLKLLKGSCLILSLITIM